MKNLKTTLFILLTSSSLFAQVQSYSGSTNDGFIIITPDGLSSATSGNKVNVSNVALGNYALRSNISSFNSIQSRDNTAIGASALYSNTTGYKNTATGYSALLFNSTGNSNTAFGHSALLFSKGNRNTAAGTDALAFNSTGIQNTALGHSALSSNTTGYNNTGLGYQSDVSSNNLHNATAIGYEAKVNASNKIRMGNTYITVADIQVAWNVTSDRRWKENIVTVPLGLDFIKDLKPVAYHRKNNENDDVEFGLIAQEIVETLEKYGLTEKDLGLLDKDQDGYYSVRYNDLLAPMIKAMQEQQLMIEKQQTINTQQASVLNSVLQRLEKLEGEKTILTANN